MLSEGDSYAAQRGGKTTGMYCVKGDFTTQIHIGWRLICGRMLQARRAVIDQQEGTEAGASGLGLGAPFSLSPLSKSALTHHPQAGGGTACGSRALSEGRPAGRPIPAQYGQVSRRHRRLVHRAELRRCTGGLGAIGPQQAAPGIYRGIACYYYQRP